LFAQELSQLIRGCWRELQQWSTDGAAGVAHSKYQVPPGLKAGLNSALGSACHSDDFVSAAIKRNRSANRLTRFSLILESSPAQADGTAPANQPEHEAMVETGQSKRAIRQQPS